MDIIDCFPLQSVIRNFYFVMLQDHNIEGQTQSGLNKPKLLKTVSLVGLMGAGKSTVGRRIAQTLDVTFCDADDEIVLAAGRPIKDIFQERGEEEFRAGERRVIARLLDQEPHIMATGGGAFMNPLTRILMREKAVTVWLRADIETLMHRVSRRNDRPLLAGDNPKQIMEDLMKIRYPIYAQADIIIDSIDGPHSLTVNNVIEALKINGVLTEG